MTFMTALSWAGASTLFIFCMTVLGAAMVFCFHQRALHRLSAFFLSFASGVMLAAAIFSLFLPAMAQAESAGQSPLLVLLSGTALGICFMLLLDRPARKGIGALSGSTALAFLSMTLHNIPEGMAVGLAFALAQDHAAHIAACVLAFGIGLQNFPEGAAVSLPLCREGFPRRRAFALGALSGVVEPLFGMLAALFAAQAAPLLPLLMASAGGAMLFVTLRETLPAAAQQHSGPWIGILASLGFLLMMSMDVMLT